MFQQFWSEVKVNIVFNKELFQVAQSIADLVNKFNMVSVNFR